MKFTDLSIPSWKIMLTVSAILAAAFIYFYWEVDAASDPKLAALLAGFSSAFLVAFFQLLSSILDALKLNNYEKLGIEGILENGRRGKKNYEPHISKAKKEILVMGSTASRFMSDFGKTGDKNNELTMALNRGVTTRFLLPQKQHLKREIDVQKIRDITIPLYSKLKSRFGENISLRYFDHTAAHSMVVTDHVCIVGPVFQGVESKDTPAVVLNSDSNFANPYIENFNREWNLSHESFE